VPGSDKARPKGGNGGARPNGSPQQLDIEADAFGGAPGKLPVPVDTRNARLPVNYQAATHALAQCERVDECKEWVNKAEAIAAYARMADDDTLYKTASRIKARAVDRCGQLLKQFKTGPEGGRPKENGGGAPTVSQARAARAAGLSKDQEVTAVRVANVPRETFEKLVESDDPPTVTKLAEIGKSTKPSIESAPKRRKSRSMAVVESAYSPAYIAVMDMLRRVPFRQMKAEEAAEIVRESEIKSIETIFESCVEWFNAWAKAWRAEHHEPSPAEPEAEATALPSLLVDILGCCRDHVHRNPHLNRTHLAEKVHDVAELIEDGRIDRLLGLRP
jgi:hypothetical protein